MKLISQLLLLFVMSRGIAGAPSVSPNQVRHVLVISIDGMHALDFALWIKNNPNSSLAQLAAQGMQFTNATSTKPVDSIPSTVGIFTGASPGTGGMFYDDAYNRAWFPSTDTKCAGPRGTVIDLKQGIDFNGNALDAGGGIDPTKLPRRLLDDGSCVPVYPHDMIRVNTVFEVIKSFNGRTAYSEKRPSYDFLNGPSGTGIDDLYAPEINANNTITSVPLTEAFDDLRVTSVINEIDGRDHTGVKTVGVPVIFGMNFQAINAAKKVSTTGGYADPLSAPDVLLKDALAHTDASIGKFVSELNAKGLLDSTAIIITAKHGEAPLDPTHRAIQSTNAVGDVLAAAGFPASRFKITQKSAVLLWILDQTQVPAVVAALSKPETQAALNISQILSGDSLKLLFPDPLTDPAVPDIFIIPNPGTNYEPAGSTTYAEHGGFNENETHVPLLIVHSTIQPGIERQPVTTTQIAPTILTLLNINPNLLQAVKSEGVTVLPGVPKLRQQAIPWFLLP